MWKSLQIAALCILAGACGAQAQTIADDAAPGSTVQTAEPLMEAAPRSLIQLYAAPKHARGANLQLLVDAPASEDVAADATQAQPPQQRVTATPDPITGPAINALAAGRFALTVSGPPAPAPLSNPQRANHE